MTITYAVKPEEAQPAATSSESSDDNNTVNQEINDTPDEDIALDEASADEGDDKLETTEKDGTNGSASKKNGFQKRREKYEAKIEEARIEAEYWKRQAMKAESQSSSIPAKQQAAAAPIVKPKLADFGSFEEYVEAFEAHQETVLETKIAQRLNAANENQSVNKVFESYQARMAEQSKEFEDYSDVVADLIELPTDMQEALLTSDVGPKLTYHLALNPDVAERLTKLSPVRRLVELGRLEDKLVSNQKTKKQITAAPVKTTAVKGGSSGKVAVATTPSEATSFKEYKALREAQLKAKRK